MLIRALVSLKPAPYRDTSDILRAQLVLVVSALDYFVHEVTRIGMLQILRGTRQPTKHFDSFKVTTTSALAAVTDSTGGWLESEIRTQHAFLAFQKAEKIADAIRMIHSTPLWRDVAGRMHRPEDDVKRELDLIVSRRNQIAHEADLDPANVGVRYPISEHDVNSAIVFVSEICGHLCTILS